MILGEFLVKIPVHKKMNASSKKISIHCDWVANNGSKSALRLGQACTHKEIC